MKKSLLIGIFALLFDDQRKVLLCHRRDHDLWNLPGGGLKPNETPWDGVIREVKEETGLDVRVDRLAGVYSKPESNEIVFSFVCTIVGGTIIQTNEADIISYFELKDIPSNTSPKQVERIRDALESNECVMKVQTGPSSIELLKQGKLKP